MHPLVLYVDGVPIQKHDGLAFHVFHLWTGVKHLVLALRRSQCANADALVGTRCGQPSGSCTGRSWLSRTARLLALAMMALHLELVTKSEMGMQSVAPSRGAWSTSKETACSSPCFCCLVPGWQLQDVGVLSSVSGPGSEKTDADHHTSCARCEVVVCVMPDVNTRALLEGRLVYDKAKTAATVVAW